MAVKLYKKNSTLSYSDGGQSGMGWRRGGGGDVEEGRRNFGAQRYYQIALMFYAFPTTILEFACYPNIRKINMNSIKHL